MYKDYYFLNQSALEKYFSENLIDILFVCLGFFVPLGHFFTHMEKSSLPVKGCKF